MAWMVGADRRSRSLVEEITADQLAGMSNRYRPIPVGTAHAVDVASGVAACRQHPKELFPDMRWPPVEMAFASLCEDCMHRTGYR